MSRVAKASIRIPTDVEIIKIKQLILIKGIKGQLSLNVHDAVKVQNIDNVLIFSIYNKKNNFSWAQAGTTRALLYSMIIGVTQGFTKKLQLVGVGYRASITNNILNMSLGYSHMIEYNLPAGISGSCPSQTEIVLTGVNKQLIGQVAANIRLYRSPERYKGKGIRYIDEVIKLKEAKKK